MRVLIVEDDPGLAELLAESLREHGYAVVAKNDGFLGDREAAEGGFDAIVLDWNLPGLSGVEICRRLREANDRTPVVMLTARDEIGDRVHGLDAGADDYLVKPFHLAELAARLRSVIRRSGTLSEQVLSAGPIEIDSRAAELRVNGTKIDLTAREFALLEFCARNAGMVLSREHIESSVWGSAFESSSNVVAVFVARLRGKLRSAGAPDILETVRGAGYRFNRPAGS